MKRATRLLLLLFLTIPLTGQRAQASLEADVGVILKDKLLEKASVGVEIAQLGGSTAEAKILFKLHDDLPLIPASNMKVLTTSAALDQLGPDFRFRTLLVQHGRDLVLVGDGDPTFGDAELLKKVGWSTTTVFQSWVEQLKKAGVTSVKNVCIDDSVFDEVLVHPRWDPAQLHNRFMAEVAGMTLNAGVVDFYIRTGAAGKVVNYALNPPTRYVSVQNSCTRGPENAIVLDRARGGNNIILKGTCPADNEAPVSITIHDPALYAATVLGETLTAGGIKLDGSIMRDRSVRAQVAARAPGYSVLAIHETPLTQVIARANKDSMNVYAEMLCKRVGYAATGESGSWANGTARVAAFIRKTGADPDEFRLDDGCGLSRENRVSADVMIQILKFNYHSANRDAFMQSLAIGGVDGTLDDRFKTSSLRGRVHAKTGYVVGVSALSGYLKTQDGRWLAFSILMNDLPRGMNSRAKQLQEAIVKAIDNNAGRSK